jgi:hypothetical protein
VKQRLLVASLALMVALVGAPSARAFGDAPNSNYDDAPGAPPEAASHALPDAPAPPPIPGEGEIFKPRPGIVLKFSSLGAGIDGGVSLNRLISIRGGSNFLNLSHGFSASGIRYDATLHFRSAEALVDITPLGDLFHISPGVVFYNGNEIIATAHVPGGQNFDLGNITVRSSPADPIHGTGKLTVNRSAPMIMFGFGNPIPHNHHVTFFQDFGVVFQGAPKTTLNLAGTACDPATGLACVNAATDPTIQAQVQNEQTKINNDLAIVKFYPIASFGIGIRF